MERGERLGLGIAVAGHLLLFGLLSVGFLATPNPDKLTTPPIEVSLAEDVALEQTSPAPTAEAAPSIAPEQGPPEAAAPAEPQPVAEPEPQPRPEHAPAPRPEPVPQPAARAPRPAPAPSPVPRPTPQPRRQPAAEPAPTKPSPAKPARPAAAPRTPPAAATTRSTGRTPAATAARPRGSRLGDDFLKGLSDRPSPARAEAAPAAVMGAQAAANIGSAILRQVQPCANRQVTPGPGAERIRVTINLRLNQDGSLAARPRVVGHAGVDDENQRYVARVDDLAIATFTGCSPLRGLPPELYDVQNGWSNFSLRYKLPG